MARYREAYEAMNAGEWLKARRLLLGLWNKSRTYDVAASLGQVEYQLLNFVAAARYMAFAVANVAPKEKYANLERYKRALEEIRAWVGTLEIRTNLSGAEIRVDGKLLGHSPLSEQVFVAPGTHTIEASADSGGKLTRTVAVAAGERLPLALDFPSAVGTTTADHDATTTETTSALVASSVRDRRQASGSHWMPVYVGAGVAATGVLAAAGFGLAANAAKSDAEDIGRRIGASGCVTGRADPDDCRAAADAVARQRRSATLSTIGIGVAGVAATATLAYIVLWPSAEKKTAAVARRPVLAVKASASELLFSGSF